LRVEIGSGWYFTKQMAKENLLVYVLGSCETMANASVICTDKTSTLSQNEMTVIAGSIGIHTKFVWKLGENPASTGNKDTNCPNAKGLPLLLSFPSTKASIRTRRRLLTTFTQH
jgi:Ca2+-transporting ATPase